MSGQCSSSGIDVNYAHPEFLATPLVASVLVKREAAALYLLSHGADPHLRSEPDGLTPAQAAQQAGLVAVQKRLQDLGAICGTDAHTAAVRALVDTPVRPRTFITAAPCSNHPHSPLR